MYYRQPQFLFCSFLFIILSMKQE
ncbi:hypothetical protein NC651_040320 [Populus alba x Populus x berolinensis]|nr:hypothetical protein NC651_040320 [Populus alba x Populus x berolinensis]